MIEHKKMLKFILPLSLLFIALLIYFIYQIFVPINNFPIYNENDDKPKIFEVNKGENGNDIFLRLENEGYIKSVFFAKVVNKFFYKTNISYKIYPGEYFFDTPQSTYQVLYTLTKKPASYAVLIPEGFTKQQVADRLAKYIKKFDKKEFLAKAQEGYLFPDTYYFYSFATSEEILKEFDRKFHSETFENLSRVPTKNEVIIASILEREARDPEEMKIISGIYNNRLKIGMPLQVDATVLYGQGAWKERTLYKDLLHESDYNTYINKGLPVGPISNPGINSLKAAMNPNKNNYLYYLTGKNGITYFAETYEQHLKNKRKYLN